jgi:hypothetical protein
LKQKTSGKFRGKIFTDFLLFLGIIAEKKALNLGVFLGQNIAFLANKIIFAIP